MAWKLNISTKSSGHHQLHFDTEDEAKEGLRVATQELSRARTSRDQLASFGDQIVVPADDVLAVTIFERTSDSMFV